MKKVLALTLVLVLALGMSTTAFAAVTKVHKSFFNYAAAGSAAGDLTDGNGRDTIYFDLEPGWFYTTGSKSNALTAITADADDIATSGGTYANNVSKRFVRTNDIDVKIKWVKGSAVFDGASITDDGQIELKYNSAIKSIKDIDYEYQVLLSIGGRTVQDTVGEILVEGTYQPDKNDGSTVDNWFKFNGLNYVTPSEYVRDMEFVLNEDEDVTVWGRALKGVKYYGHVDNAWNPSDEKISLEHPEIIGVYHIDEINLKTITSHVTFNNEDGELYVYDGDLNLLGQVKDKITSLEDTYYLASAILDVDTEIEPEEGDEGDGDEDYDWGDNSGTGGDDLYPENPHDNPGTGR